MSIVHTKDTFIIFIVQGQVITNSMGSFLTMLYFPRFDFPPVAIISVSFGIV